MNTFLLSTYLYCAVLFCHFSCVRLFATLWTVAHQAPLSMGFSRKEYWSELPCLPPGDLLDPGIELASLMSPALADMFSTTSPPGKPMYISRSEIIWCKIHILSALGDTATLLSRVIVSSYVPTSSVCYSISLPTASIFSSNFSHSGKGIVELHLDFSEG